MRVRKPSSIVARYVTSVALVGLFLGIRLTLGGVLGDTVPYLQFFPAIMLAAWLGGLGPGLLGTALASLLARYFFLQPAHSFMIHDTADAVSLPLFFLIGTVISLLVESLRRAEEAQRVQAELANDRARALTDAAAVISAARSDADAANRLKDDFLATLSHELRTPLNAIAGYARLLRRGVFDDGRREHALRVIERNAATLTQMVEDVLDVSRIVAGKIRINVQTVDIARTIEDAVATVKPAADARGVRIHTVLDVGAGPVAGDPERLQQVVWNLLSNAVKFTPRDGRVQVRLARVESHVEIAVSDTGAGIPPEFLPHVFERFRQADSRYSREHGGLGLGLAIAREVVHLHGGTIHAASDGVQKGATFVVRLPVMIVHATPELEPERHPADTGDPVRAEDGSLNGVRVLVADDDHDATSLLREVLEHAGASVAVANGAREALSLAARERPDVLLTDIGMPEMDGFALLAQVRASAEPALRDLPAAALTAYARPDDRVRVLKSGFQMHLAKPIDPDEVVAAVAALVRTRNVVREHG